jgi:hypothetical protein
VRANSGSPQRRRRTHQLEIANTNPQTTTPNSRAIPKSLRVVEDFRHLFRGLQPGNGSLGNDVERIAICVAIKDDFLSFCKAVSRPSRCGSLRPVAHGKPMRLPWLDLGWFCGRRSEWDGWGHLNIYPQLAHASAHQLGDGPASDDLPMLDLAICGQRSRSSRGRCACSGWRCEEKEEMARLYRGSNGPIIVSDGITRAPTTSSLQQTGPPQIVSVTNGPQFIGGKAGSSALSRVWIQPCCLDI